MSISEDNKLQFKLGLRYLAFSAFLVIFNIIYSLFAHGIGSRYMEFAFLIPFIGGTLVSLLLFKIPHPGYVAKNLWRMGLFTLVIGFLLHGVFDIYGTEVGLVNVFFTIGGALLISGFVIYIVFLFKKKS